MDKEYRVEVIEVFGGGYHENNDNVYLETRAVYTESVETENDIKEKHHVIYLDLLIPIDEIVDLYDNFKGSIRRHYENRYMKVIGSTSFNEIKKDEEKWKSL